MSSTSNKNNKSVDKANKVTSSNNKSFSKTKNLNNNSANFNSREDKNYVRKIFNNLNQNKDYDEKISFTNNYATVKVSATCVSTKNNNTNNKGKKELLAGKSNDAYDDFLYDNYSNLKANNTQNALTNYSYLNYKNNNLNKNSDFDLFKDNFEKNNSGIGSNSILNDDVIKNDFDDLRNNDKDDHYKTNSSNKNNLYDRSVKAKTENLNQVKFNNPILENINKNR